MKFKDYILETKLILKAKVLDIKDFIKGTYKTNSDGTIEVTGNVAISKINLKKIPWNIVKVSGYLRCYNNQLQSLGNLKYVGGNLLCHGNKLESLGNLEYVGGYLWCQDNKLKTLGNLKYVGENLLCYGNTKKFTEEEIRKTIEVKGEIRV